ncbi:Glycoside hydrolase, family 28 [Corchorus capsularis]|uniref:Glycoside hydrolase, family 28 n=1 Tax=Corchorus capsularis TaxID=210143 RepID=A0A1R3G692_COCAP|nr:Glycoside hydrolase, family 28 [Corchorus capsularis]
MGLAPFGRRIISAILLLCLALHGCEGQVVKPFNAAEALALARKAAVGAVGPDVKTFNVVDYGAKADGTTNNAFAFIKAFKEACNFNGNAMMVIPDGKFLVGSVVFEGPCSNPSPLIIQVNGYILATPTLYGYPQVDWFNFQKINGLILTGHGTFHGQGATVWQKEVPPSPTNPNHRRPASIKFNNVDNAIIRGITSIDAKGFHIFISNSENFRIFNIDIQAPDTSPNTDGIHMSKSSIVKISKTKIGTDNGLRIKTYMSNIAIKASNIFFQDISMTQVQRPIIINQEYNSIEGSESSKVSISDVYFTNVRGTSASKTAVSLICSKTNPCSNVHLNNVDLKYDGKVDDKLYMSNCTNVQPIYGGIQDPPPCPH